MGAGSSKNPDIYEMDVPMSGLSYRLNQRGRDIKLLDSEFGDKEF